MPEPKKDESKKDFINRCTAQLIEEEGRDPKQASAICHSMWNERKKGAKMSKKLLRMDITKGLSKKGGVNRELHVIEGYAVMSKGNIKDSREWEIDNETLRQVAEAGNAHKLGLKSRFGHPNMSNTALGTFLGRAKNFRVEGNVVRADLHISDSAFNAPSGDLGTYVLEMAENEPDMFGTSVVLRDFDLEQRLEKDGTAKKDEEGNKLPPLLRVKALGGTDVVDEPAANDGMFATQFFSDTVMPSASMTEFLDKFLASPEAVEKTIAFLDRYRETKNDKSLAPEEEPQLKKGDEMELKDLNMEALKAERPDLAEALGKEATENAEKFERQRVLGILSLVETPGDVYKGMGAIAKESITSGESIAQCESKMKDQRIKDLEAAAPEHLGVGDDVDEEGKPKEKSHLQKARDYRDEHGCDMTEALRKTAPARK